MNRRRLEFPTLDEAGGCLDAHPVPKPFAQVQLDSIGREIGQFVALKRTLQMFAGPHIGIVSLGSAHGRLGIGGIYLIRFSKDMATVSPTVFPIAWRMSARTGSLCVPSPSAMNELRKGWPSI
jgi:hypothetical protein